MGITPLDIRKQTFKRSVRGVDAEEVRSFLELVAGEFESAIQESVMLSEKVRHIEARLAEYHGIEKTLQNSLITAERIAVEARESSRREAESIVNEAQVRSERMLEDARERLRRLSNDLHDLRAKKDLYVHRFKSFLDGQTELLDAHLEELADIDELAKSAEELQTRVGQWSPGEPQAQEPASGGEEASASTQAEIPPSSEHRADPVRGVDAASSEAGLRPAERPREPAPDESEAPRSSREAFFPPAERREGFYEISADETPKNPS